MSTPEVLDHLADPKPLPKSDWVMGLVKILQPVASLKLTVTLFALSMVLVFFGTLAQMDAGIWTIVDQYFWSYWVKVELTTFGKFLEIFFTPISLKGLWFPFPAGKTIGFLMFINLLAAHTIQLIQLIRGVYKTAQKGKEFSEVMLVLLKRSGIYLLHAGLLLLFVGEYITREFQLEQQMRIAEGSSSSVAFDTRNYELAFVNPDGDENNVTVIPRAKLLEALKNKTRISHEKLPVDVEVLDYFENSDLVPPGHFSMIEKSAKHKATHGIGLKWAGVSMPPVSGVDSSNNVDIPSSYIKLFKKGSNDELGILLATGFTDGFLANRPEVVPPFNIDGQDYTISLRLKRYYKPYTITLNSFTFEQYIGTDMAKNYASHIRLEDATRGEDRLATISMNNPLRYNGETFYQHQFSNTEQTGKVTTLALVDNPGWKLPYISCVLVTLGMTVHFAIMLVAFLWRMLSRGTEKVPTNTVEYPRTTSEKIIDEQGCEIVPRSTVEQQTTDAKKSRLTWFVALPILILSGLVWLAILVPSASNSSSTMGRIARIPVIDGGRVKPLDTVARTQMRLMSHRETYKDRAGNTQPALKWFLESALTDPRETPEINSATVFRIENDQVREMLQLKPREGLRYSLNELQPRALQLDQAIETAMNKEQKARDLYDNKVLELSRHVKAYIDFCRGKTPLLIPPSGNNSWRPAEDIQKEAIFAGQLFVQKQSQARGFPDDPKKATPEQQTEILQWFEAAREAHLAQNPEPVFTAWEEVLSAYRSKKEKRLEQAITAYEKAIEGRVKLEDLARVQLEAYHNETAIYFACSNFYVMGVILCFFTWIALVINRAMADGIRWGVLGLLIFTCAAHAFVMISRMYLMERPLVFVTNLYSSAVFIGLVSVMVCIVMEFLYPLGIGNFVGCALGGFTAMIGHNLALAGDTLEMMQAVLDTNLWLATHVTTVTFGYSATYVAGAVGLLYLLAAVFPDLLQINLGTKTLGYRFQDKLTIEKVFNHLIYGIVCLAMFMSFVGTVLGGIWADQSWGRFWGWDPKENGAVLIVIWNALILHARWAGLVKTRGMALLTVVGIMITTWSWFGTNQLSVGLHAYGFNKQLAFLCASTWVLCSAIMAGSALHYFVFVRPQEKLKDQPVAK